MTVVLMPKGWERQKSNGDLTQRDPLGTMTSSMLQEVYAWIVFGIILTTAGYMGISAAKKRYENDVLPLNVSNVSNVSKGSQVRAFRRPFLVALCAYSLAVTWFFIAFMVVTLLVWCTFLQMTRDRLDVSIWQWLVDNLAKPSVVLRCFDEDYVWTHVVFSVIAVAAAGWIVGFYITDEDLAYADADADADANSACYRKTLRALGIIPSILATAYIVFALSQIIKIGYVYMDSL